MKLRWLWGSILVNLGLLGFFKYYNFFSYSLNQVFSFGGISFHLPWLDILHPIGISFYTFQTLSYTIDIYRGKLIPEKHLGIFAVYVSFFPQLVAGPIERATSLLPQFKKIISHFRILILSPVFRRPCLAYSKR